MVLLLPDADHGLSNELDLQTTKKKCMGCVPLLKFMSLSGKLCYLFKVSLGFPRENGAKQFSFWDLYLGIFFFAKYSFLKFF